MSTGVSSLANVATNSSALKTASGTSTASGGVLSKVEKDRKTIAQNFDQFLSLLTTQLKNQSPLDPLDANQFTQQLVQFSSVEQQLKTNDLLTKMAQNAGGGATGGKLNAASAASLIGTRVSVDASTTGVTALAKDSYEAKWPVTIPTNYGNYQVSVTDANGAEVYRAPWSPSGTGEQVFKWTGTVTNPGVVFDPKGQYTLQVSGELNGSNGQTRSRMATETSGTVSSVDLSGNEEMVQFGDYTVPMSRIKKVSRPLI
jgi:flagellar basal-body rod modification protein FlgD